MARGSVKKRCQCRDADGREIKGCRKPHGSWAFIIDAGKDEDGRRRQIKRSGFRNRDAAEQAMTEELRALDQGTWVNDKGITVGDYLDRWLDGLQLEVRTLAGYRRHVRLLWRPRLGHLRLRDLRRHHVEDALRTLGQPLDGVRDGQSEKRSPATIDSYRRTLRAALSDALRDQLVAANWAQGDMRSIPAGRPRELVIWEPEQTARFLDATRDDTLHALYVVAAFAGLRRGELLGARWTDLDDDGKGITLRQTLVDPGRKEIPEDQRACPVCGREHKGLLLKGTKSAAGDRWVPFVQEVQDALRAHRKAQAAQRLQHGRLYADHGLIFCLPDGDPLLPSDVTKAHAAAVAALELPKVSLHDMRHGACSILLAGGVPVEVVQMILGHSSPEVTRKVYAHVLRGETARQAERASRLVSRHRAR